MDDAARTKVFVHLAFGFGAETWNKRYLRGDLIGMNEPFAYGYHHANGMGCDVTYSTDNHYGRFLNLCRLGIRALLGFDVVHAYRNRAGILSSEVIWTHTESQFLAILFVARLLRRSLPPMICQSVWLIDDLERKRSPSLLLKRHLASRAGLLTFHSPLNASRAAQLFPLAQISVVKFGINDAGMQSPKLIASEGSLNIVAVGNDRHRDWSTLEQALGGTKHQLTILSQTYSSRARGGASNIRTIIPSSNDEFINLYEKADVAIVSLKPNLHASGITVILEALILGKPVICTDTGGLRYYFTDDHVYYSQVGDPQSILNALRSIYSDPDLARKKTLAAQEVITCELNSVAFARTHAELSRDLLLRR